MAHADCTRTDALKVLDAVRDLNQQRLAALKEEFEHLRKEWGELRKRQVLEEGASSPRFNVFRLVGIDRSEVGLHSPILCDLLNPYGSHGQGTLFLHSFLSLLATRTSLLGEIRRYSADLPDPGEWSVQSERDRIDISIRNRRAGLIIFIENKIDAGEQEEQLFRYRQLLDDEPSVYEKRLLVFLSPRAYGRPQSGEPHVHLYYEADIAQWLHALEAQVEPLTLRGTLCQYRTVIENLSGGQTMSDSALIGLLARPENIRCALDISNTIGDVKRKLRLDFWEQVTADLQSGLSRYALSDNWTVQGVERFRGDPNALTKDNTGVFVVSTDSEQAKTRLHIGAWQGWYKNGRMICYGIGFSDKQPTPYPSADVVTLRNALPQGWGGPDGRWLGCWTDIDTNSDDFLCRVAEDRVATSRQVTDAVINLLRQHLDLIPKGVPPALPGWQ